MRFSNSLTRDALGMISSGSNGEGAVCEGPRGPDTVRTGKTGFWRQQLPAAS